MKTQNAGTILLRGRLGCHKECKLKEAHNNCYARQAFWQLKEKRH